MILKGAKFCRGNVARVRASFKTSAESLSISAKTSFGIFRSAKGDVWDDAEVGSVPNNSDAMPILQLKQNSLREVRTSFIIYSLPYHLNPPAPR